MINDIAEYERAGIKAAEGVNNKDWAFTNHWQNWFNRAKNIESPDDKKHAETIYKKAYEETRKNYIKFRNIS
jgi:hypothetical protein